jgi:hypothetical protein
MECIGDREFFLSIPIEERIELYRELIKDVVVNEGEVTAIHLRF